MAGSWWLVAVALLAGACAVAGAIAWGARAIAAEVAAVRAHATRTREVTILETFAPAIAAASADPRAIIVWQPIALTARALFPEEFDAIDRAMGTPFPFSRERLEAAHAQWTAEWLAWERSHDAEYKRRAAEAERQMAAARTAEARAAFESVESEKLTLYQRRYEEYVRIAKSLQGLAERA